MRLLDRYLLRELLIPLGFCLGGFLIFWDAFSLFNELNKYQEKHLNLGDVLELYAVRVPGTLVLILPIVLLLALLYTLTNHARHHELTAIRAAGISLVRLCVPYLAVGLLLSLGVFFMNEHWVPYSADHEKQIMNRHEIGRVGTADPDDVGLTGFKNPSAGRYWAFKNYNLRTHVVTEPRVVWRSEDGVELRLVAHRAEYVDGAWTFFDDVKEYSPTNNLAQTNVLAMPEFAETPAQIDRQLLFDRRLLDKSLQPSEAPIAAILDYLDLHHRDLNTLDRAKLVTQLHGRLAMPWTCLVVVLIAIPFGAASGRRNLFAGVAGSIAICFIYFVLMKLCLALGSGGWVPGWLAGWAPNFSFTLAGIWLMLRVR